MHGVAGRRLHDESEEGLRIARQQIGERAVSIHLLYRRRRRRRAAVEHRGRADHPAAARQQ
jgi:hypothetical protein